MSAQRQIRIALLNAENLFLFMDKYNGQQLEQLSERDWQDLSSASVPNKPIHKVRWLAASLREIDPDFILLNEVGGLESLENFNKHFLGGAYRPLLIEGNSDRGIDIGYLVRQSLPFRYLLNSHKRRPLDLSYPHEVAQDPEQQSSPRPHFFSRDVAELRVFAPASDKPLLVFLLTHLKSKWDREGIDPEGRDRRRAEVNKLVEIYQELRVELGDKTRFIVAGDFNGRARSLGGEDEFQKLHQKSDLKDIFEVLGTDPLQIPTQVQFRRSTGKTPIQIDHIFVSENLSSNLISSECYVYRYKSDLRVPLALPDTLEQRGALPSDHYPVVAGFLLLETIF